MSSVGDVERWAWARVWLAGPSKRDDGAPGGRIVSRRGPETGIKDQQEVELLPAER